MIYTRFLFVFLIGIICSLNVKAQSGEAEWLQQHNNPNSAFWQKTTASAYPVAVGIPAGLLVAGYATHNKQMQKSGWKVVGALVVNGVISQGMKYAFNRERPYEKYPAIIKAYDYSDNGKSFPSGHTSTAFAMAASVSIEYKKWYIVVPAYTYATAVGCSRLYLGEHYPTDVLGGAVVGVGSAYLSNWLSKKIFKGSK
jgi:undecaprenyl-diphosphatase